MRWRLLAVIVSCVGFLGAVAPAWAEHRVALVIGNSRYETVGVLPNPSNDAELVAGALRSAGIDDVTVTHDVDRNAMAVALKDFASKADGADWAMIYYAGHGIEVDGTNYLVPVDARLGSDRDVPFETISLDQVMGSISGARKPKLVVLDACRNNPFLAQMRHTGTHRALQRGLSRVEPEGATLVVYAAKEGTTAQDGDGADSPFAMAFARRLAEPGVEINKALRFVRDDVLSATGNRQEPFVYGSLPPQDFYFVPPASSALAPAAPLASNAAAAIAPEAGKAAAPDARISEAAIVWPLMANSTDIGALTAFKQRYAGTVFEAMADSRIASLKAGPAPAVTPPSATADADQPEKKTELASLPPGIADAPEAPFSSPELADRHRDLVAAWPGFSQLRRLKRQDYDTVLARVPAPNGATDVYNGISIFAPAMGQIIKSNIGKLSRISDAEVRELLQDQVDLYTAMATKIDEEFCGRSIMNQPGQYAQPTFVSSHLGQIMDILQASLDIQLKFIVAEERHAKDPSRGGMNATTLVPFMADLTALQTAKTNQQFDKVCPLLRSIFTKALKGSDKKAQGARLTLLLAAAQ